MTRLRLTSMIGALAIVAGWASTASAEDSSPWGAACTKQVIETPFTRWKDTQQYTLVPGGTFENQDAWTLEGGAAQVAGNEPFYVHGRNEGSSLLLVPGAAATSKPMCVTMEHPTIRMFVRNLGLRFSFFSLQAVYKDDSGALQTVEFARLAARPRWSASPAIPYLVNVDVPLSGDGTTAVAFRLVGLSGVTMIDDVYVDPRAWF